MKRLHTKCFVVIVCLEEEQVGGRDYNRKETNKASYNVNLICLTPENDVSLLLIYCNRASSSLSKLQN